MKRILFLIVLYFLPIGHAKTVVGQEADSTIRIIAFPYSSLPKDLGNNELDNKIRELGERLPNYLETEMQKIKPGRVRILVRKDIYQKLKETVDFENTHLVTENIKKIEPKSADYYLETTIEKAQLGRIRLQARALGLETESYAIDFVYIQTEYLTYQDSLDAKIQHLADSLVNDLIPVPKRQESRGILRDPRFWSGAATGLSLIWLVREIDAVENDYNRYNEGSTIEEVTKARIDTEKSETRRTIAIISTAVTAVSLVYFLASKKNEGENRISSSGNLLKHKRLHVDLDFNNSVYDNGISVGITYTF